MARFEVDLRPMPYGEQGVLGLMGFLGFWIFGFLEMVLCSNTSSTVTSSTYRGGSSFELSITTRQRFNEDSHY
jgi:hypothetical protein